jgi:dTDP-4-dehydrorhamnose 3,5-epimerase
MKFTEIHLNGAFLVNPEKKEDHRGFFARFFCENEFKAHNLVSQYVQINTSLTIAKGTLRGMHYQLQPSAEVKVVSCTKGSLFDVILDIRPDSPTFGKWYGTELTSENRTMMYVPRGFAHGFMTLQENTEVLYMVSAFYAPELERGIRYNDPGFNIQWPVNPVEISDKDKNWPNFDPAFHRVNALKHLL